MDENQTKFFRQWLVGYFMSECGTREILDITFDVDEIKKAQAKAEEVICVLRKIST